MSTGAKVDRIQRQRYEREVEHCYRQRREQLIAAASRTEEERRDNEQPEETERQGR